MTLRTPSTCQYAAHTPKESSASAVADVAALEPIVAAVVPSTLRTTTLESAAAAKRIDTETKNRTQASSEPELGLETASERSS
jgi:hypothetical protein